MNNKAPNMGKHSNFEAAFIRNKNSLRWVAFIWPIAGAVLALAALICPYTALSVKFRTIFGPTLIASIFAALFIARGLWAKFNPKSYFLFFRGLWYGYGKRYGVATILCFCLYLAALSTTNIHMPLILGCYLFVSLAQLSLFLDRKTHADHSGESCVKQTSSLIRTCGGSGINPATGRPMLDSWFDVGGDSFGTGG